MHPVCINPLLEPPRPDRILVIRLGAVGDVLRTLPAFGELRTRHPDAHIAWMVEGKAEGAVRGQPGIDEVIVFPREELEAELAARQWVGFARRVIAFVAELRRRRFELVLDFHAILKTGWIARVSGARWRVGYARPFARELSGLGLNRRARIEPARISRYLRNAALVDFLGTGPLVMPRAEAGEGRGFAVSPELRESMQERLAGVSRPLAVIHPGSSAGTPYKRYPVAAWAAVTRSLAADGVHCIVSAGGPGGLDEGALAESIVRESGGSAQLAPPTGTLGDLAALFQVCDLFIGSDSGPLHLASLVGTPVVQLLGPTDPVENRPWPGTPSRSVRVPVGCSPCRRGCPAASCMTTLPPAVVAAAARELLEAADLLKVSA